MRPWYIAAQVFDPSTPVMIPTEELNWHLLPDVCLEIILASLPPSSLASLRLTSCGWRKTMARNLVTLSPTAAAPLDVLSAAFPGVSVLRLKAGQDCNQLALAPLREMPNLQSLELAGAEGPWAAEMRIEDQRIAAIAAMHRLTSLSLTRAAIDLSPACRNAFPQLKSLRLTKTALNVCNDRQTDGSGAASRPASSSSAAETPPAFPFSCPLEALVVEDSWAQAARGANWTATLAELSQLTTLQTFCLSSPLNMTDKLCATLASLPRLENLELAIPAWSWQPEESGGGVTAAGVAALRPRKSTLRSLILRRCFAAGADASVLLHVASLTGLTRLELTASDYSIEDGWRVPYTAASLQAAFCGFTSLRELCVLHVNGYPVGLSAVKAFASLPACTHLEFTAVSKTFGDAALFELARSPRLRSLGLRCCPLVTDIGLSALFKGPIADSLLSLDLTGCDHNITDTGLAALADATNLRKLGLYGCDAITDAGLLAALAGLKRLEQLTLSDTKISDVGCMAVAAAAPNLVSLEFEHCGGVTDRGAAALGRLKHLREVRAFGSGVTCAGVLKLRAATGAVVQHRKPCWWSQQDGQVAALACGASQPAF